MKARVAHAMERSLIHRGRWVCSQHRAPVEAAPAVIAVAMHCMHIVGPVWHSTGEVVAANNETESNSCYGSAMPAPAPLLRRLRLPGAALVLVAAALVAAGCGSADDTGDAAPGAIDVVATTTQLGDVVREVGGDQVAVHQLLQPNTDPHEYEPRPDDVKRTASAKVVFESGDNLDKWMGDVVSQSGSDATVVDVGSTVTDRLPGEPSGEEASKYDPHWWHDPVNVVSAIGTVEAALAKADPANAKAYAANAEAYRKKVEALDAGIEACFAKVPPGDLKLVTDHDAFGYFAKRYGLDVVGAVIPSQTTKAQPSAKELTELARTIKAEHVKAVFPESSVNPKLAQAIARTTGARADLELYGDTLGPKGSSGDTYLKMEQANADAMVTGFTGGEQHCAIPGV